MKRKLTSSGSAQEPVLAREEWDFRKAFEPKGDDGKPFKPNSHYQPLQFLPTEEVDVCHTYEFAREDNDYRRYVLEWRKPSGADSFDALMQYRHRCRVEENKVRSPVEFYAYWPEWPKTPYLRIKPDLRLEYWKAWTGRKFSDPPRLEVAPINYLFAYRGFIQKELKNTEHSGEFKSAEIDQTGEVITFADPLHRQREIAAFVIRYNLPDDELLRRFGRWLHERRVVNGISNPESRGEQSYVTQLRTALCALGAWRLVHRAGMGYEAAEDYTDQVSGKPLFKGIATWSRNVNPAAGHGCEDFKQWRFWFQNRSMKRRLAKRS